MTTGLFLLVQDLIARNISEYGQLFSLVKYAEEIIAIVLFALIICYHIFLRSIIRMTNIDFFLVFFIIINLISGIINKVPFFIFLSQSILYLKGFFIFFIFYYLRCEEDVLKKYILVFFRAGAIVLFFGFVDLIIPHRFRALIGNAAFVDYRFSIPSVQSVFTHPVYFGWFMSFMSLFSFAFFAVYKKTRYFFMSLCFFAGCFLSMRVKSIIGFAIALFAGFLLIPLERKKHLTGVFLIFALIVLLVLGPTVAGLFQSKMQLYVIGENRMDAARNVLYIKSAEVAVDHFPFGAGPGRFGSWLSRIFYSPVYEKYGLSKVWGMSKENPYFITDTFWPMILGESGILGCLSYIIILLIFFFTLRDRAVRTGSRLFCAFYMGAFMVLIESIAESIATPVFVNPPPSIFVFGAIGICYSLARTEKSGEPLLKKYTT
ncbi:MAG: hypothetical protein JW881_12325 [Spirochaetales bacterium]|nr:hypothetical protein [Spirochaetales bacterium]